MGDLRRTGTAGTGPGSMIGETIGQYRIEAKLGEGGVGEVYRAVDVVLGRTVALKRLRPELTRRADVVERFRAEACTLAQLNHPNIAILHQLDHDGDDWFMVMEYVEGTTVSGLLQRRGPLPVDEALELFVQALDGLGYAHEQGIVHRDIKGSNLIVMSNGLLKIMDFGIARVLGAERLTMLGHPVGTPEYMSPEQIRGEDIDGRADIYALGSLLYALLSGETPFQGGSDYELMRAQMENQPPALTERVASLPDGIAQAALRALAKDPADRFATTAELREALAPWMNELRTHPPLRRPEVQPPAPPMAEREETTRVLPDGLDGAWGIPATGAPQPPDERTTRTLVGPGMQAGRKPWRRALRAVAIASVGAALLAGTNWLSTPDPATDFAVRPVDGSGRTDDTAAVAAAPADVARPAAPPPAPASAPAGASAAAPTPEPRPPMGQKAPASKATRRAQPRAETAEENSTPRPATGTKRLHSSPPKSAPVTSPGASDGARTGEEHQGWVIRRQ
jgi:serine/threonine-protein kinase